MTYSTAEEIIKINEKTIIEADEDLISINKFEEQKK